VLNIDLGGKNAVRVGKEEVDLKLQIHGLVSGYATINVLQLFEKDLIIFGEWNDRPVTTFGAQQLYQSFITQGVRSLDPDNFMELIINTNNIDLSTLSKDMHAGDSLPPLHCDDAEEIGTLYLAGGRHRVEALKMWANDTTTQIAALKSRIAYLEAHPEEVTDADEKNAEALKELEILLPSIGIWGVRVFEWGKFFNRGHVLDWSMN